MKRRKGGQREQGQVLVLFAVSLTAILLTVGLVIDGGNGLTQRRDSQNTADFAAFVGARVVAEWIGGDTTNGTDTTVKYAIIKSVAANGGGYAQFRFPSGLTAAQDNGGHGGSGGYGCRLST